MHPLKIWRRSKCLTQKTAAKRIGCSLSTYINWEYFLRNPSPRNVRKISAATGGEVTAEQLFRAWDRRFATDAVEAN
ncbi:helix-turn-helix transcriptional regulator [Rhodobacterales bacterium]|nr:helix-turn-helix transcriptional regulator [Rhodobacterales bacterium]